MDSKNKMTIPDAEKLIQVIDSCCKTLLFTKSEVSQIATICLQAIHRAEQEVSEEAFLPEMEQREQTIEAAVMG